MFVSVLIGIKLSRTDSLISEFDSVRTARMSKDGRLATLNLQDQAQSNERVRRLTLINSVIGVAIAGISTRVFMISVPTLATALDTDMLGISWALIVYQMAGIGLGVICGRLGDIYGHHKTYGLGMGIMALGSLLCGFSQNVVQLILFRFVQGVGGAMIQSSGRTLAFRAMPHGSEGKAQGLMAMSHQFGFFVGPPIGGLIIDWIHWRGVFFFLFVPSSGRHGALFHDRTVRRPAAGAKPDDRLSRRVALLRIVDTRDSASRSENRRDSGRRQPNIARAGFCRGNMEFHFSRKEDTEPDDRSVFLFGPRLWLRLSRLAAVLYHPRPGHVRRALLSAGRAQADRRRLWGLSLSSRPLLSMVLSPVSGALTDRIGARFLLISGTLILMVSFLIGANLGADTHWIWPAILLALTGVGSAFFNTPSQAVMIGALPKEHWGTAIGIINGIFGLGHMLGISLSGIFLTLAFRYYSGIPGTTPNPGDTQVFVASMNVTYVFALVISIIPLLTSLKMKKSV